VLVGANLTDPQLRVATPAAGGAQVYIWALVK